MQQTLIADGDKAQLKRVFRKDLTKDVKVRLFTQKPSPVTVPGRECRYCAQTQQLMEELAALSPKLHLETVDFYQEANTAQELGVARIPAILLGGNDSSRLKFYGIPMGYTLAAVVEDIKSISRGVSALGMGTRKKLRQINRPVHIQVFVTPSDTSCPGQARLAHAMALDCPHITSDVVEIQEFPALAQTYGVKSVPLTVINEHIRLTGVSTEAQMLDKVLQVGAAATQDVSATPH